MPECQCERDGRCCCCLRSPTPSDMVAEFHERFGARRNEPMSPELYEERDRLLREEAREFFEAWDALREPAVNQEQVVAALAKFAKEAADLTYVVYGSTVNLGVDLDLALALVHDSNMAKMAENGSFVIDERGKIRKPLGWREPDLRCALPDWVFYEPREGA